MIYVICQNDSLIEASTDGDLADKRLADLKSSDSNDSHFWHIHVVKEIEND